MTVVSNTSPLTNLAAIGQFDLLRRLYGQIHLPAAVWAELNAGGRTWPGRDEVDRADWIERHQVQDPHNATRHEATASSGDPGLEPLNEGIG